MANDIGERKDDHISLCCSDESQARENPFDKIRLPYRALPEISHDSVDTSTTLLGKRLRQPLIVASMTGGTGNGSAINHNLASAAEERRVALSVGSQRIAIERPEVRTTFRQVRDLAPSIPLLANMGAVQLNYGMAIEDYLRAVDMIEADALYLHLNPLQEAIQPGGDRNYSDLLPRIEALVSECPVPVFAKEVGHGIDQQSARQLIDAGVAGIDVAGVGGTSYAWVEAARAGRPRTGEWFHDFGIPTTDAIETVSAIGSGATIVASGGVRSPIDGLKACTLGADLYSAARPFLIEAIKSPEATVELLEEWEDGLRTAMFITGSRSWPTFRDSRAADATGAR